MVAITYNNIPFDPNDLANQTSNFVLGQFMTAWSQAESICGFLFRAIANIEFEIATIIYDRVGAKEQIEILEELIVLIREPPLRDRSGAALKEVRNISIARNKIVHAGNPQ